MKFNEFWYKFLKYLNYNRCNKRIIIITAEIKEL